jgi:hypothetical protein
MSRNRRKRTTKKIDLEDQGSSANSTLNEEKHDGYETDTDDAIDINAAPVEYPRIENSDDTEQGEQGEPFVSRIRNPIEIKGTMRTQFLIFMVIGIFVIVFDRWTSGFVTVGVMLTYLLFGFKNTKTSPAANEVFADSLYYMGFLFTFVALFMSIGPFGDSNLASANVIGYLGIALLTTVVGMGLRLILTHFDQIVAEPEDDLRELLGEMVSELHRQLEQSIHALSNFRETTIGQLSSSNQALMNSVSQHLNKEVESIVGTLGASVAKIDSAASQFHEKVSAIELPKSMINDKFDAAFGGLEKTLPKLAATVDGTVSEMTKIRGEAATMAATMNAVMEAVAKMSQQTSGIKDISGAVSITQDSLSNLNSTIQDFGNKISKLDEWTEKNYQARLGEISKSTTELSRTADEAKEAAKQAGQSAEEMQKSIESAATEIVNSVRNISRRS